MTKRADDEPEGWRVHVETWLREQDGYEPYGLASLPVPPDEPKTWRNDALLRDPQGRLVLGVHCGGGSDMATIEAGLGQRVGLTTVYWDKLTSPRPTIDANLAAGVVTRLELELTTALVEAGAPVTTLWRDITAGMHDEALTALLTPLVGIGRLVVASICHEADYAPNEQGGYGGKVAGRWEEFGPMFRHVVTLARSLGVTDVLWYFNMGGGYTGAPARWDAMWPGDDVVDLVGFDAFNPAGVRGSQDWREFADTVQRYGRLDWCKAKGKPVWIGETGTCEVDGHDAGAWLTNMADAASGLGIATVIYFSDRYADHTRQLDDDGQKQAALPALGAHAGLAFG